MILSRELYLIEKKLRNSFGPINELCVLLLTEKEILINQIIADGHSSIFRRLLTFINTCVLSSADF
jgi:hypothetical protein